MLPDFVIVFTMVRLYPVTFTVLSAASVGDRSFSLEVTSSVKQIKRKYANFDMKRVPNKEISMHVYNEAIDITFDQI